MGLISRVSSRTYRKKIMPRRITEQQKIRQMMGSTSATIGVKRKPKDRLQLLKDFKKIKQNYNQSQSESPATESPTSTIPKNDQKILGSGQKMTTSTNLQTNYNKKAEITTSIQKPSTLPDNFFDDKK